MSDIGVEGGPVPYRPGRRDVAAAAPSQLRVTDLIFVPTWDGVASVCFITDNYSHTIVGYWAASHMRTTMVLDVIERGRGYAAPSCPAVGGSDAEQQFTSSRYGVRLAEIGTIASIGTVADSCGSALAETVNCSY